MQLYKLRDRQKRCCNNKKCLRPKMWVLTSSLFAHAKYIVYVIVPVQAAGEPFKAQGF